MVHGGKRLNPKLICNTIPIVSIITVVYNDVKNLEQTVCSILEKDCEELEYLIIDGGSTDSTINIIKKYEEKIDYWLSEKDKGIYDAMNKGAKLAKGEYLLFLNSQDIFTFDIKKNQHIFKDSFALIYGKSRLRSANGNLIEIRGVELRSPDYLFIDLPTSHQAIFYSRKYFEPYDLNYKIISDRVLTYKIVLKAGLSKVYFCDSYISDYFSGGFSDQNLIMFAKEKKKFMDENAKSSIWSNFVFNLNVNFRYRFRFFSIIENSCWLKLYRKFIKFTL